MLSVSADTLSPTTLTYGRRKNWNKDYAKVKFKPEVEVNIFVQWCPKIKGCMPHGHTTFLFRISIHN